MKNRIKTALRSIDKKSSLKRCSNEYVMIKRKKYSMILEDSIIDKERFIDQKFELNVNRAKSRYGRIKTSIDNLKLLNENNWYVKNTKMKKERKINLGTSV